MLNTLVENKLVQKGPQSVLYNPSDVYDPLQTHAFVQSVREGLIKIPCVYSEYTCFVDTDRFAWASCVCDFAFCKRLQKMENLLVVMSSTACGTNYI